MHSKIEGKQVGGRRALLVLIGALIAGGFSGLLVSITFCQQSAELRPPVEPPTDAVSPQGLDEIRSSIISIDERVRALELDRPSTPRAEVRNDPKQDTPGEVVILVRSEIAKRDQEKAAVWSRAKSSRFVKQVLPQDATVDLTAESRSRIIAVLSEYLLDMRALHEDGFGSGEAGIDGPELSKLKLDQWDTIRRDAESSLAPLLPNPYTPAPFLDGVLPAEYARDQ